MQLNFIQKLRKNYLIRKECAVMQKNINHDRQYIYDLLLYLHIIENCEGFLDNDGKKWVEEMKYIIQDNLNRLNQLSDAVAERNLLRMTVLNSALQYSSARLSEKAHAYIDLFEKVVPEG